MMVILSDNGFYLLHRIWLYSSFFFFTITRFYKLLFMWHPTLPPRRAAWSQPGTHEASAHGFVWKNQTKHKVSSINRTGMRENINTHTHIHISYWAWLGFSKETTGKGKEVKMTDAPPGAHAIRRKCISIPPTLLRGLNNVHPALISLPSSTVCFSSFAWQLQTLLPICYSG